MKTKILGRIPDTQATRPINLNKHNTHVLNGCEFTTALFYSSTIQTL